MIQSQHGPSVTVLGVTDPEAIARHRKQDERHARNLQWLQAHWADLPHARGRFVAVADRRAFVADTAEFAGEWARRQVVGVVTGLAILVIGLAGVLPAAVEPLRLEVPVFGEINTHLHRPADLEPQEKRPAVLLVGGPGCPLGATLAATQRLVVTHFTPAENVPPQFRAWEEGLGHAGQDTIAILLKHLLALPEVDRDNVGLVTFSFGVVGGTGALARHPELRVKFLIDWEGPSGPQNLRWVPADHKVVRRHPATDEEFWQQRTASEFIKGIRCRYLRVQSEEDHVQVLGHNQHAIEMLNNATGGQCPWTRCNDNSPNILYNAPQPEKEKRKWFPGKPPRDAMERIILGYIAEMTRMAPLEAKKTGLSAPAATNLLRNPGFETRRRGKVSGTLNSQTKVPDTFLTPFPL